MPPREFGRAVLENDVKAFTRVSGVGKAIGAAVGAGDEVEAGTGSGIGCHFWEKAPRMKRRRRGDDVYEALLSLGCTPVEAKARLGARAQEFGRGSQG